MKFIKHILILLFTTFYISGVSSQNKIDSLKAALKTSVNAEEKINLYKQLLGTTKNDSTAFKNIYDEAIAYSKKQNEKLFVYQILYENCRRLYSIGKYNTLVTFVDSVLPQLKDKSLYNIKGSFLNYKGNALSALSKYAEASTTFIEYLEVSKQLEDNTDPLARGNNNLGMTLNNLKRYKQAIPYLEKSIALQNQLPKNFKAHTYWNLGIAHMELLNYDKALDIFKLGLEEANKVNDLYAAAGNQTCIASIYSKQDKFSEGLMAYKMAHEMALKAQLDPYKIIEALNGIIYCFNQLARPKEAITYINQADSIIKKHSYPDIRNREFLFQKSNNLLQRGLPQEADIYFLKYERAYDSLQNIENLKIIQDKETQYRTKEKEQMLKLQNERLKKQQILIGFLIAVTLLIGFLGYLIYQQQQLKIKQKEQEQDLKEALYKVETQNKLEEQRLRISKELHDNIGSQLTYLTSATQTIEMGMGTRSEAETRTKLLQLAQFSQTAINDLRDTVWVMNKGQLNWNDLIERTRYLGQKIANTTTVNLEVLTKGSSNLELPSEEVLHLFRIIQEATNNAIKHAYATAINIMFNASNPLEITIIDNGVGFNTTNINESSSGINNMKSRAQKINTTLTIESNESGTTIKLTLPYI